MMCPVCKVVQLNRIGHEMNLLPLWASLIRVEPVDILECPTCEGKFYKVLDSFDCKEIK